MESMQWLRNTCGTDSVNAIAQKANMTQTTLARQVKRGELTSEAVLAIARGYHAPVLDALVTCNFITTDEAHIKTRPTMTVQEALTQATDQQLAQEILNRCNTDGWINHPILTGKVEIINQN